MVGQLSVILGCVGPGSLFSSRHILGAHGLHPGEHKLLPLHPELVIKHLSDVLLQGLNLDDDDNDDDLEHFWKSDLP